MTFNEAYDKVMPEKKRNEERFNIFVSLVVRPVSIIMTLPLVNTKVKPTTITKYSIVALIIGFGMVSFGKSMLIKLIGWGFFFLWSLLDGVDGNLARCTNQCSLLGDLWDTMGGYMAMILINFSAGIAAFYDKSLINFCDAYWLLILGGASAIASIFPRIIMHKKKSSDINAKAVKELSDKQSFGLKNIFAMNVISPSGFMQMIFLLCIVFHTLNIFITFYMFINSVIMLISLGKLLRD